MFSGSRESPWERWHLMAHSARQRMSPSVSVQHGRGTPCFQKKTLSVRLHYLSLQLLIYFVKIQCEMKTCSLTETHIISFIFISSELCLIRFYFTLLFHSTVYWWNPKSSLVTESSYKEKYVYSISQRQAQSALCECLPETFF